MKSQHIQRFTCCLGLLFGTFMQGQELPNVLPQSPEAASLGKFGQVPVGLFTGTPQLNIPIYEFKSSALSIPIALNYSSNGVRVDEYASSVGLGWSLSAGGVITRSMYHNPDEQNYLRITETDLIDPNSKQSFLNTTQAVGLSASDVQPDIFSFNFNGFSGKFYLDDNSSQFYSRNIVFLEPTPLKVELINASGSDTHFKITDPSGIEYYFGGTNAIEEFSYQNTNQVDTATSINPNPSAWYLTKITHPSGEVINFSYASYAVAYANSFSQSITRETTADNGPCSPSPNDSSARNIAVGNYCYLTQISSVNTGEINFTYSHKAGMFGGFRKLDNVEVRDQHSAIIKGFNLNYQGVTSSLPLNTDIPQESYYAKRFFLSSVTEVSSNNTTLPPYTLEYKDPTGIPPRFSYAQDYWGFYNGKNGNSNLMDQKTIAMASSNPFVANLLSGFSGGDRTPDPTYCQKGLLTKMIYPTGGSAEITYEGHAYYGTVMQNPVFVQKIAQVNTTTTSNSFETIIVPYSHRGYLNFGADINDFLGGFGGMNNPLDQNIASVRVYDITGGGLVARPIYAENDEFASMAINTPYGVTTSNHANRMFTELEAGHQYRFEIVLNTGYTLSHVALDYFEQAPTTSQELIPVGGMRVAQVNVEDAEGTTQTKKYHYGDLNCLDCDSGVVVNRRLDPSITRAQTITCGDPGLGGLSCHPEVCSNTVTLSTNTAFPIYGTQGYHIGYSSVVEEYGNNFEGGAMVSEFDGNFVISPSASVQGDFIPGTPIANFFNFGRQLKQITYAKNGANFDKVQEVENLYTRKTNLDKETIIYTARRSIFVTPSFASGQNANFDNGFYDISQYPMLRQWHVMSGRISKQYDANGANPVTTQESYFYDNSDHLQRTKTEVTNSEGEVLRTVVTYPQDLASPTTEQQQLINLHQIAFPITQKQFEVDGGTTTQISEVYTQYTNWGNNLLLPEKVQTAKATDALEDRVAYLDYDDKGNVLEVMQTDGSHTIYIWGYNQQYPIAKIDNATYVGMPTSVTNSINAIIAASNTENSNSEESSLRGLFQNLRNHSHFANAQMTSLTYDPMVGTTSTTDPRGYTMTYIYDSFNRLVEVRDANNKLVSDYSYNYQN